MLLNTNVTLHSEIEILAEYKTKLEAKEACEGVVDPKNNEELKKVEALHKRQLAENRKLRKENKDLKKKLAEIQNENAKQSESEQEQTNNTEFPPSETNQLPATIPDEDTQCEIPQVNCTYIFHVYGVNFLACRS